MTVDQERGATSKAVTVALVGVAALVGALAVFAPRLGHDSGGVAAAVPAGWETSLTTALARAGAEKKLVMVDFYTDWCGWCKKLDKTTFADAEVRRALERVVPVKLNAETDGRPDAQRLRVDGYPTIVFLNAAGVEVGRIPGYLDAKPFIEELGDILKKV